MSRSLLAAVLVISSVATARAEAPPLPEPTSGSCQIPLPEMKLQDGSPDTAFVGTASCLDFLGKKFTLDIVKKGCPESGSVSPAACPTSNVLVSCRRESKAGLIIERFYAAPDESDLISRAYNKRIREKGCKAPATLMEPVSSAAPPTVHVATGGARPLPAPSKGSCTAAMPKELKLTGPQNCFEFPGDKVSFDGIKSTCESVGTASPSVCSTANVLLSCTRDSGRGQVVERWYGAANADTDPTAKTYNQELLKKGCTGAWKPY